MRFRHLLVLCLVFGLGACSVAPVAQRPEAAPARVLAFDAWEHQVFPGKRPTDYTVQQLDGRAVVAAHADASASLLRQHLRVEPADLGRLRFSWKAATLLAQADLAERGKADSPVRVLLAFEGDRSKFSATDAVLSELAYVLMGEHLPYATLMYVWCNACEPGTVIPGTRTQRVRKLALESGPQRLNQWLDYERDIRADFEHAFGEAPGALVGIGLMTDSDNTRDNVRAWYGPMQLEDSAPAAWR